jgi:RNA-binding protein
MVRALAPKTDEQRAQAVVARALTGKATRYLRARGHHVDPTVQIGKEGISAGVVAAAKEALLAHELIKVRILSESPVDRKLAGAELAERAGAFLVQTLGRTLLLYKRHPHKPKLELPR